MKNPQRLQQKDEQRLETARNPENLDALKSQLGKLQRGVERLIDSYSDGAIDKQQFMSRLSRTKGRIAELEAKIHSNTDGLDHGRELRLLVDHFRQLANLCFAKMDPSVRTARCSPLGAVLKTAVSMTRSLRSTVRKINRFVDVTNFGEGQVADR